MNAELKKQVDAVSLDPFCFLRSGLILTAETAVQSGRQAPPSWKYYACLDGWMHPDAFDAIYSAPRSGD